LRSGVDHGAMRKRGERVERSFAHVLNWLRGRDDVHRR
jgi:hypothetical protein